MENEKIFDRDKTIIPIVLWDVEYTEKEVDLKEHNCSVKHNTNFYETKWIYKPISKIL
jgi:hypothetical protein